MQGYKTVILSALALAWVVLAQFGFDVPAADQASIGAGVVAFASLLLRLFTSTPVFTGEDDTSGRISMQASAVFGLIALAIGACSTLGIDSARLDTVNKQIVAASGEINALASLTNDLYDSGVINDDQARQAITYLQISLDVLKEASAAVNQNGDPLTAENKLQAARRSIQIAISFLQVLTPDDVSFYTEE